MYGSSIQINFKKKQAYTTTFGGIVSLFIFLSFGLGVWFFGQELINRKSPTVISSNRSVIMPKRIDIHKNNLIIMMGVYDLLTSVPVMDPSIFTVRAHQDVLETVYDPVTQKNTKRTIAYEKKMKICDIGDVGIPQLIPYFQKLELNTFFCFAEQEVFMEGDYDSERFSEVYFYVEKCKNSTTSSVVCKSPEEINNTLKLTKLLIYLSDTIIDPINYDNPFERKGINLYSPISSSSSKELQIYFTNDYIENDIGVLYKDINNQHGFHYTDTKETSYFSDHNTLIRVLYRLQKQKEHLMQRRYTKLADVIAQIGGLLKILTVLGGILVLPFSQFSLNKQIVDEIFNFDQSNQINQLQIINPNQTPKQITQNKQQLKNSSITKKEKGIQQTKIDEQQQKQQQKQEMQKQENCQSLGNSFQIKENLQKSKSFIDKLKQKFQVSKNTILFKFSDKFKHVYFKWIIKSREKHELIEKGIQKVVNQMDVLFILNKLHEIDKLKSILFDFDQLKLFEYIPKPVISKNNIFDKKSQYEIHPRVLPIVRQYTHEVFDEVKTDEEKANQAFQGLLNIMKKKKRTKIDDNLINMIDQNIFKKLINEENDLTYLSSPYLNLVLQRTPVQNETINEPNRINKEIQSKDNSDIFNDIACNLNHFSKENSTSPSQQFLTAQKYIKQQFYEKNISQANSQRNKQNHQIHEESDEKDNLEQESNHPYLIESLQDNQINQVTIFQTQIISQNKDKQ